ncbi:uncharacterized protein B0H18DRAFT_985642 [Fomitopsis serialis]|uniref:uncharacterized protein n=1 Tax=Fomitopsis serialis TaxID=139415 RepID=UPI002008CF61|nr:uncharacterized protein B0H18DRAFT_985642 [Neoantrodia serialis]KAH9932464.1 hypothetical protein B0H18DRAFT_985642 [Neoantrodia serialis]
MKSHRVFLGAPLAREINEDKEAYHWQTVSSIGPRNITLLPDTIEAASRRISALYENIIFQDDDDESHYLSVMDVAQNLQMSPVAHPDDAAAKTWPLTVLETTETQNLSKAALTFLRPTASISRVRSMLETQDTRASGSFEYSDASSVGRFPEFHFSIHTLTTLSQLAAHAQANIGRAGTTGRKGSQKVTILAAVLEVEGPDTIRIKKGAEAGKEVSLLKLILGDEEGCVCKLTAWRETAETWGGADAAAGVKRGDIVLLENVLASWGVSEPTTDKVSGNAAPVTLTASANVKSRLEICYRTMPLMQGDKHFRPDLRLGFSDASVRKVAAVVEWFEDMAGLTSQP